MAAPVEVPVPPQYQHQPQYDFRQFPDETRGFKVGVTKLGRVGTKRELEAYAEQVRVAGSWQGGQQGACMRLMLGAVVPAPAPGCRCRRRCLACLKHRRPRLLRHRLRRLSRSG